MRMREIRLRRLRQLIAEFGSAAEVARLADTDPAYLSQLITGVKTAKKKQRAIGDDLAERLEQGCGKPPGWMDREDGEAAAKSALTPAQRHILEMLEQVTFRDYVEVAADLERRAEKAKKPRAGG